MEGERRVERGERMGEEGQDGEEVSRVAGENTSEQEMVTRG